MRFAGFFLALLVVFTLALVYVHRRSAKAFGLSKRGRRALGVALGVSLPLMLAGRALARLLPGPVLEALAIAGSVMALGILISAILLALLDAAGALMKLVRAGLAKLRDAPSRVLAEPPPAVPETPAIPRRTFIGQAAASSAILAGGGTALYGTLFGRHDYIIEEVVVRIPGLARALDGFTIVQLSDLHIGQFVGEPELAAAVSLVKQARPDLVVLTGDLIDHDVRYADMLGAFTRRLSEAAGRAGLYAIPGNHDYYAGIEKTLAAAARGGARVLKNAGQVIGDAGGAFALLGVDDAWGSRMVRGAGPDLAQALASVPPDLPRVLLAHNPMVFHEAASDVALQLSGHTHGGQVNLLLKPAELLLPYGYFAGVYERGGARLYVNRGFGTAGPPARIGAPPEVTRIVLVSG